MLFYYVYLKQKVLVLQGTNLIPSTQEKQSLSQKDLLSDKKL